MLDNVIDINYYAVPEAKLANMKHRPVGLGLMGFQDALYLQGIPYSSEAAVIFADHSMELISYAAIEASAELAVERGAYQTFKGSLWHQGILPILHQLNLLNSITSILIDDEECLHIVKVLGIQDKVPVLIELNIITIDVLNFDRRISNLPQNSSINIAQEWNSLEYRFANNNSK